MAKDPVCGMDVNPEKAAATSVYQGTTYYFCAPGCKRAFDDKPTKYVDSSGQMKGPKPMAGG
ncbi:MAG: YHS domain-containing protein [Chloroflexi bacterium]|nr:YHS domain-containing protein [Chloroflexota bacterium]